MILYHFTSRANLDSIMAHGLNRGEAPLSDTRVLQAVNLTSDSSPHGHGLDGGGDIVTAAQSARYLRDFGWVIPAGTVIADKREVRLTVKIRSSDPKLKRWLPWAMRHCEPGYPERLANAAGGMAKAETWWLYFGTVLPSAISSIDDLQKESSVSGE